MKNLNKLIILTLILSPQLITSTLADTKKIKSDTAVEELKIPAFEHNTLSKTGMEIPVVLLDITAPVKPGGSGTISVKSDSESTIILEENKALKMSSANTVKTNKDGKASFTFTVNSNCKPGMLPIFIKSTLGDKHSELKTYLLVNK